MCRVCKQLGVVEGDIWYFDPRAYARRLYKRPGSPPKKNKTGGAVDYEGGRIQLSEEVIRASYRPGGEEDYFQKLKMINDIFRTGEYCTIMPLKDAKRAVEIAFPMALMMCMCRKAMSAMEERSEEEYSCMGIGLGMYKWEQWPEIYRGGVKFVGVEEAQAWLEKWDKRGMVKTVMQNPGGGVVGICNCTYPLCYPLRWCRDYGFDEYLIKGHYVAKVDSDKCNGCAVCIGRCQFGAIANDVRQSKVKINMSVCTGCGLCETGCRLGAIELVRRETIPWLKNNWYVESRKEAGRKAPKIEIDASKCPSPLECKRCILACPQYVFQLKDPERPIRCAESPYEDFSGRLEALYADRCVICGDCQSVCPNGAISITV